MDRISFECYVLGDTKYWLIEWYMDLLQLTHPHLFTQNTDWLNDIWIPDTFLDFLLYTKYWLIDGYMDRIFYYFDGA